MGKIRAKDVKPKTQPGDFKKKKAKVGRKIKPANITKIKVQTKRIQIPLQAHITGERLENERDLLDKALKLLQHHSTPSRTAALEDLKSLLASCHNAESYVSLVFPPALELLFDEERDVRNALHALLSSLLTRFSSSSFVAIVPIMITYICSGLTNLHKGVRRDALGLLLCISQNHPRTLLPHLEKLVEHVLALLFDSSQLGGSDSLAVATTNTSGSSSSFGGSGGVLARAKSDKKLWKAAEKVSSSGSTVGGREEKTKPTGSTRPPLLLAVLEVLHALLTSASINRDGGDSLEQGALQLAENNTNANTVNQAREAGPYQAIILRPMRRTNLHLQARHKSAISTTSESSTGGHSDKLLTPERLVAIINCLRNIWRGLVLDNSVLPTATINLVTLVARVACTIGDVFDGIQYDEFKSLVNAMFENFPHTAVEATVAAPGSAEERSAKNAATALDMALSNLSLLYFANPRYAAPEKHEDVCGFVMQILHGYVDDLENEAAAAAAASACAAAAVELQDNSANMQVEDDNDSLISPISHKEKSAKSSIRANAELSKQVFGALEIMIAADGRRNSNSREQQTAGGATPLTSASRAAQSPRESEVNQWSMSNLLGLVKRLVVAFSACAAPAMGGGGARSFLMALQPALHCLFRIASDDSLWHSDSVYGREDANIGVSSMSFKLLVESMALVAPLVATLFAAGSQRSSAAVSGVSHFKEEAQQLADSYTRALLAVVRRINAPSDEEDDEGNIPGNSSEAILEQLSSTVATFFMKLSEVSLLKSDPSEQKAPLRRASIYLSCAARTRYTILDILGNTAFTDTLDVATAASKMLSHAAIDASEQQYLLRVLHERRAEMGVADYMDMLFAFLKANVISRSNVSTPEAALKAALDISSKGLADDVADSIVWCSSADAPEKIITFVESRIRELMRPLSDELKGFTSSAVSKGSGGSSGSISVADKQKNKFKSMLTIFGSGCATTAICFRLLSPLLSNDTASSDATSSGRDTVLNVLADICVAQLVLYADTMKEMLRSSDADYARIFASTVRALALRVVDPRNPATATGTDTGDQNYPVLKLVVSQLGKLWPKLSKERRSHTVGGLGALFLHHDAIAMVTECREYVNSTIAHLKKTA